MCAGDTAAESLETLAGQLLRERASPGQAEAGSLGAGGAGSQAEGEGGTRQEGVSPPHESSLQRRL